MAAVSNNSVSAVRGGWTSSTIVCVSLNKYLNFRGMWYGDSPFDFIYPHGFGQNHHPVSSLPLVVLPSPPSQAAQIRLLCPGRHYIRTFSFRTQPFNQEDNVSF